MIFIVRSKMSRKIMGLFVVSNVGELFDFLDEKGNPYEMEFHELRYDSAAIWFDEISEETFDTNRYPVIDGTSFDEDIDASIYDAYQEFLTGKSDTDEMEWQLFDRKSYGRSVSTEDALLNACNSIEFDRKSGLIPN